MSLARMVANGRETPIETKQRVWREYGKLVIDVENDQMTWDQREMLRALGFKWFGARRCQKDSVG